MPEPTEAQLQALLDGVASPTQTVTLGSQSITKRSAAESLMLLDHLEFRARDPGARTKVFRQLGGYRSN